MSTEQSAKPSTNSSAEALAADIKSAIIELAGGARYPDLIAAVDQLAALASPPVQAREQAKAVAEVVVEPDYWSRGHFHKGYKKTVRVIGYLTQLPTGTKLYAHEHQGCEHWRNGACGREPCDAECRASPPAEQAKPVAVTEEMVTAYLTANDAYWKEVDALPTNFTKKWRHGTPSEATRVSLEAALAVAPAEQAKPSAGGEALHTYASFQATNCAGCGKHKHTPLRIDAMGGYVCLTCIDQKLGSMLGEFGYPEPAERQASMPDVVRRVMTFAGKKRNEVRNPNLTARETIVLADWIHAMLAPSRGAAPTGAKP